MALYVRVPRRRYLCSRFSSGTLLFFLGFVRHSEGQAGIPGEGPRGECLAALRWSRPLKR